MWASLLTACRWSIVMALVLSAGAPWNPDPNPTGDARPDSRADVARNAAIRHILDGRLAERSDLAAALVTLHGSLSTIDRLASAVRAELGRPTTAKAGPALQRLLIERQQLGFAREEAERRFEELVQTARRLGRPRDAAAAQLARRDIAAGLGRLSTLLDRLAAPASRSVGQRSRVTVDRVQQEARQLLGQLRHDSARTTRQAFRPALEVRQAPVGPDDGGVGPAGHRTPATPRQESRASGGSAPADLPRGGTAVTPEITALAQDLGFDPRRIYRHVRNGFRFEPYFGLLKGAQATLESGGGNDYDLAVLTGALLEASGYPVRYARGTAIVPASAMVDWLGLEDVAAANVILNTAGIAAVPVVIGPVIDHYRVDRLWVEVQASLRPGEAPEWFPLDPAFKRHDLSPGLDDILVAVPFDESGYLSATRPELTYEYYQEQVRDWLTVNDPTRTLDDVPLGMVVVPETIGSLPRSLPYRLFASGPVYDPLPEALEHKVTIRVRHLGLTSFSHQVALPAVSLKRITVSYIVDPADQAIVDGYGGLANTPAGAVDVIPRLRLDGTVVAQGGTIPYLDPVALEIDFFKPGPTFDGTSDHSLRAGEWSAIGIDAYQISDALLQRQAETIVAATELAQSGGTPDPDDQIGAFLYFTIMHHHQAVRGAEETAAALAHFRRIRGVSEGMAAANQDVVSVGGVPFTTVPGALVLDVPRQIVSSFALDNDNAQAPALRRITGFNGSAQEHATWEELLNVPSVSTIKSLQLANEGAIPIFVIDSSNDQILIPQLTLDPSTETQIQNEVNAGNVVTVPRDPTPLNDWDGVGYLSEDLGTGAAAFIISGGLNSAVNGTAGRPGELAGGAITIILEDGTILVIPAGQIGLGPGSSHTGDPVNIANGNFIREEVDFTIPALAWPLSFERTYNSQSTDAGALGLGWSHNYADRLVVQPDDSVVWIDSRGTAFTFQPDTMNPGSFLAPPGLRWSLTFTAGSYTLRQFDGHVQGFNGSGRLLSRADRNGSTFTFAYDGSGRLQTVSDPASRSLTFTYHPSGKIATVADFTGRVFSYTYGTANRLAQVASPADGQTLARVVQYAYDGDGRLASITEPNAGVRQLKYYANGRVAQVIDPLGQAMTLVYNPFKSETWVTDERGLTEVHEFNSSGNLVSLTHADGTKERWAWTNSRMTSHTNELGDVETFQYDAQGNLFRSTDATGVQTEHLYEPPYSNVTQITRPGSRVATLVYDAQGNLAEYHDAGGGLRTHVNNAQGLPQTVTEPDGAVVTLQYNNAGLVTQRTTQLPSTETIGYTPRGRVQTRTDANLHGTTLTYDLLDRLTRVTDAETHTATMEYDASGRLVESVDPRGNATSYEYDALDRLLRTVHPDGSVETLAYDALGNLLAETDELGRVTRHEYDPRNRRVVTRFPDGGVLRLEHDRAGRLTASTDPLGNVTRYEYDAAGRVTRAIDALGHEVLTTYDGNGNVATVTDRTAGLKTFEYDGLNRLVEVRGPEGQIETIDYNANGHVTERTRYDVSGLPSVPDDPRTLPAVRKRTTAYDYDVLNRLATVTDGESGVVAFGYDAAGNLTSRTDPRMKTQTFEYDRIDRQVRILQPDGGVVRLTYDAAGNRTSLTTARGGVYRWTYDTRNRLTTATDPLGQITTYEYDRAGNLRRRINADGTWVTHEYDPRSRVTRTRRSDGSFAGLVYDVAGNIRRASTERTQLDFSYDALNRRLTETLSLPGAGFAATVGYGYDDEGRIDQVTDPTGRNLTYARDLAGRLTGVSDSLGPQVTVGYTGWGDRGSLSYGNGRAAAIDYDDAGRPVAIDWTAAVAQFAYTRDPAGNPTLVTESLGGAAEFLAITYDDLSRPTTVNAAMNPVQRSESFGYDLAGNLVNPGTGTTLSYNLADQLLAGGGSSYQHDAAGNRSLRTGPAAERLETPHDPSDRIAAIRKFSGSSLVHKAAFTYDALNRLVEIDNGASVRRFVHAAENRLVEFDGAGGVVRRYTMGPDIDDGFATTAAGAVNYLHRDPIGHVRALTDAAGVVVNTTSYGLFGRVQSGSGPALPALGFAARPYDAVTGLVDMRARQHDPATARFLSRDPLPLVPNIPNPYIYANNRPLMFVDPLGQSAGSGWLDGLQLLLDIGGLIPGLGEPLDLINAGIYAARGDWVNAALSAGSAIPIGGYGFTAAKVANKAADALDAASDVNRLVNKTDAILDAERAALNRPYLRNGTRDAIQDAAPRTPDGRFIDPNTGEVIDGPFHYGHTYGHEHRRLVQEAQAQGMTQKQFNDWVNSHPEWFQIESPASNVSHRFEKPGP